MKIIRFTVDEELLEALDADEEVRRDGRSAVLRRAALEYLRRRRADRVAEQYRRAYGNSGAGDELKGWEKEGVWPES
jgi:metal-responsive CopG/Arc/MetJ family transcriptional regulator